jgi:tetratricopeptide (TPR) repeat protein
VIAAREGGWANALHVEVANEAGALQAWPLHLASEVAGPLSLDGASGGLLLFTLSPEATGTLAEGAYQVRVRLDTREAGDTATWKGGASAVPVALRVAPAPQQPTPVQERSASFARATYQLALGDAAQAAAEIDALLQRDPSDRIGLLWKGDLLESAGRTDEALAVYEQALEAFWAANPDAEEPPAQLMARRDALLRGLVHEE